MLAAESRIRSSIAENRLFIPFEPSEIEQNYANDRKLTEEINAPDSDSPRTDRTLRQFA